MTKNYIPTFFKDKIILIFNYFFSILSFLFSVFLLLSLYSFNIDDNSFLQVQASQAQIFLEIWDHMLLVSFFIHLD